MLKTIWHNAALLSLLAFWPLQSQTKVVILGSGNPNPDPMHQGCSVAVVVGETPYVVDFGPGVVRQTAALSPRYGGPLKAFESKRLKRAFLTHLHSDHTAGYADLILTPWVMGRDEPLEVYGPEGLAHMTEHLLEAYSEDIRYRLYGLEPANNEGWRVNAHEFRAGKIYEDSLVTVEAFPVVHGSWPNAFGFRFTTPDKVVVISGDTAPCESLEKNAAGADILVHEVYSYAGWETKNEFWKRYHQANHTSTYEVGELAAKVKPGLLICYHTLYWGSSDDDLLAEIATRYKGRAFIGQCLQIFE